MFCPQCGTNESDVLKFCKSCGANLQAVREAANKREVKDKVDWSKNWVSEVIRMKAAAKEEWDRVHGNTPEKKRLKEIKAGVITASVGVGLSTFLFVFMQGIVLGGKLGPDEAEILSRLWVVGVIPLCIGLGLLINGLFVQGAVKEPRRTKVLEMEALQSSLPSGEQSERIPSALSVTEETTRHLIDADLKESATDPHRR